VPAGFADGVDDTGADSVFVDSTFLHSFVDTVTGAIHFDTDNDSVLEGSIYGFGYANMFLYQSGSPMAKLYGQTFGSLYLYNQSGAQTLTLDATKSSGGKVAINDASGVPRIFLDGSVSGDASVQFPNDAISNSEILDEPGVAEVYNHVTEITSIASDSVIDSITITVPTSGYVVIQATGIFDIHFSGTTSNPWTRASLGRFPNSIDYDNIAAWQIPTSTPGQYFENFAITLTDTVSAGSQTYYLNGTKGVGSTILTVDLLHTHLTAMFFPTAYGSVISPAPPPPGSNSVTSLSPSGDDMVNNSRLIDYRPIIEAKQAERMRKLENEVKQLREMIMKDRESRTQK
ncbi:MAG: hypothetical protein D6800_14435, partial [Candidatus Zixiibacteriota bacterium]